MAKMTLEQAEKIMAKQRNWFNHGLTDFQVARKLRDASGVGVFMFGINGSSIMRHGHFGSSVSLVILVALIGCLGWFGLMALRYAAICALFEAAAPQNLSNLRQQPNPFPADHHVP